MQIWPLDPTPITFLRLLIRYKWIGSGPNMQVRIEIICQLFDFITTTNGSRANNDLPPLTYDEQEKELKSIMQRGGVSTEIPLDRIPKKNGGGGGNSGSSGQQTSQNQASSSGKQSDKKPRSKSDPANAVYKGSNVCFGYNNKKNPCRNDAVTGGCKNKITGRFYAHVCNYFSESGDKFCLGSHSYCGGQR